MALAHSGRGGRSALAAMTYAQHPSPQTGCCSHLRRAIVGILLFDAPFTLPAVMGISANMILADLLLAQFAGRRDPRHHFRPWPEADKPRE
jgi:hypothetical protein